MRPSTSTTTTTTVATHAEQLPLIDSEEYPEIDDTLGDTGGGVPTTTVTSRVTSQTSNVASTNIPGFVVVQYANGSVQKLPMVGVLHFPAPELSTDSVDFRRIKQPYTISVVLSNPSFDSAQLCSLVRNYPSVSHPAFYLNRWRIDHVVPLVKLQGSVDGMAERLSEMISCPLVIGISFLSLYIYVCVQR